ncbi:MAG: hypothetical protein AAF288_06440 [Planctomycetota bacterium]
MNGFERLMRNVGLMVHNVRKPEPARQQDPPGPTSRDSGSASAQNKDGGAGKVVVRRTTIEEVELRPGDESR